MKGKLLKVSIIFFILTGCAYRPIPIATAYPTSNQHKMQAAHHWDVLAKDLAKRLKRTIAITFPNATVKPPLVVRLTGSQEKVPFAKAFNNLLISRLVQQKMVVLESDYGYPDSLIVEYNMQVIQHKDRRLHYPTPGIFTALTAGVFMADRIIDYASRHSKVHAWVGAVPFAIAGDVIAGRELYLPGETNTEVLINTSVLKGQQYIFRDSRIYYINDGDSDHYDRNVARTKTHRNVVGTKTYQVRN